MLDISSPIISVIPFIGSFVLIWRLLVPISLVTSFIAAVVATRFNNKLFIFILCVFTIFSSILNWGNRRMVPENVDGYKNEWSMYTEYYVPRDPVYIKRAEDRISLIPSLVLVRDKSPINILTGKAVSVPVRNTPIDHEYALNVVEDSNIKENTFYFPGWKVIANNKEVPINYEDKANFGLITFRLNKGLYKVNVIFADTQIRIIGKYISSASLVILLISVFLLLTKSKKKSYRI